MQRNEAPVADWVTIPDLYRDPFPIYERLRAEGGVHWVPQVGRYLITSYAAVHETELDQQTFSANEQGSLQIRAMGHSMLRRDDPEHYLERKAWQPALRPGVVKRVWRGMFERNAERYLAELIERGPEADLIWDFAAPYAAESLREILGLHNVTQQQMQRWSQTMIDATGNYADDPEVWAKGKRSFDEVDEALAEMLPWHAANPNESLLSQLLRIPDYEMPIERIRANVKMTIGGGLNEPRDALGVAAWGLLTHPEQRRAVEADPSLWHAAFDETLRWVAPIGLYSRQTTREVELTGVRLPAGAKLGICILSANRDERVWEDAHRFDVRRAVKPHLAFSKGVHVCLGAWVARSEVAEVALPMLFDRLQGLELDPDRETEVGGWVFRGMLRMPVRWQSVRAGAAAAAAPAAGSAAPGAAGAALAAGGGPEAALAPRIGIAGSGPAGCFTAQALRRRLPGAHIDVLDALPVPYGLVRSGVAADHHGTKSVARQFDRLFLHEAVRFRGSLRIGDDVALDELRAAYDVVVLATGMHADRSLGVPGDDLEGVHGAGRITRLLNAHPDEGEAPSLGERVAIIGHGNVAMDVARLLARDAEGLEGSDVDDDAHARLASRVRTIHLVGRSGPSQAKFDPVMVRELAGLPGVAHRVHGAELDGVEPGKDARADAVRLLTEREAPGARVEVHWWFGHAPVRLEGDGAGGDGPGGDGTGGDGPGTGARAVARVVLRGTAGDAVLDVDAVVTAVGFAPDADSPSTPGAHPDGRVEPGLYTAGWLRRGPRGTIPDQRTDARELARAIAEDVETGAVRIGAPGLPERAGETDFDGWRRIELREQLGAAPGRSRAKLRTVAELLAAAADDGIALPEVPAESAATDGGVPVTILFGTESGGAELVAEELARSLGDRADVVVRDLADAAPGDLDASRLHLIVCATYGDGEVPTSARPFHEALLAERPDLAGLRYAVFGMGDRSYTKTYSRGSELIDEALAAAGAERLGEYGRHDAGGPVPATEAAADWAAAVLADAAAPIPTP
ncbi:cytochrome P450 [Agrococcus carbonis]|uniref:Cytochrome P450 n=1 Tax=Agrococcus carbonis TaxID=684552 RepID=A0A1H1LTC9_9MICO|nr:cytochrome P450 [Agrococcus carbonis]SDR77255.1 Cytochrome P450 [Agrococcus carbonis]